MVLPSLIGYWFGFLGAIPVAGPVSALVLNHGLKKNNGRGMALASGAALAESVYVFLAFMGFNFLFLSIPRFEYFSKWAASLILIVLGFYFILQKPSKNPSKTPSQPKGKKRSAFLFGFTVSMLNPTLIATWTTVITTIHAYHPFEYTALNSIVFSLGVAIGIISWFAFVLFLIRKNHHRINDKWIRWILMVVGILLICLGLFSSKSIAGENKPLKADCTGFLLNVVGRNTESPHQLPMIQAPEKGVLQVDSDQLITQNGVFVNPITQTNGVSNDFMARVVPDSSTSLGRIARALEKNGTMLVFDDLGLEKLGGGGYFSANRRFRLFNEDPLKPDVEITSKVIALRESMLNTRNFQRIFMHEGLHYKGRMLRDAGIPYAFNSLFKATEGRSLFSKSHLYQRLMHHEEVGAYANNFIFAPVKAHHRKTLQEIEKQMKLLPVRMEKQVKLKQVKIDFNSVIDEEAYQKHWSELSGILESHLKNIEYVDAHLSKYRRSFSGGEKSQLMIYAGRKGGPVVLETDKLHLTLWNVRVDENKTYDLNRVFGEVAQMKETDQMVQSQIREINELVSRCRAKGHFTAEEYLQMKDRFAQLSKSIRLPSLL